MSCCGHTTFGRFVSKPLTMASVRAYTWKPLRADPVPCRPRGQIETNVAYSRILLAGVYEGIGENLRHHFSRGLMISEGRRG